MPGLQGSQKKKRKKTAIYIVDCDVGFSLSSSPTPSPDRHTGFILQRVAPLSTMCALSAEHVYMPSIPSKIYETGCVSCTQAIQTALLIVLASPH